MFFKHFSGKNLLPGFYISEKLFEMAAEKDAHYLDTIFSFKIYSQHSLTGSAKSRQAVSMLLVLQQALSL